MDRNQLVETLSEELYKLQSKPHEGKLLPSEELRGILPTASSYSRSAGAPVITTAQLVYGLYQKFPLFRGFLSNQGITETDIKNGIESVPRTEEEVHTAKAAAERVHTLTTRSRAVDNAGLKVCALGDQVFQFYRLPELVM